MPAVEGSVRVHAPATALALRTVRPDVEPVRLMPALAILAVVRVALVREGLASVALVRVGDVASTTAPEPVESVCPVPPLATGRGEPSVRDDM